MTDEVPFERILPNAIRQLEFSQRSLHNGRVIEGYEFIGGAILLLKRLHAALEATKSRETGEQNG